VEQCLASTYLLRQRDQVIVVENHPRSTIREEWRVVGKRLEASAASAAAEHVVRLENHDLGAVAVRIGVRRL